MNHFSLEAYGIKDRHIYRNQSPAKLYEHALKHEEGSAISDVGALMVRSGDRTGRSPKDKRIVDEPGSSENIWWGDINIKLSIDSFNINKARAIDFFNHKDRLYVVDGYAGWDETHRLKIRIVCTRAYHALFMHNMLIRPTAEELKDFGTPDYVIFNAGQHTADPKVAGVTGNTSVALNFASNEMVILGTEYAGEMKKGVFTIMNYLMPKKGSLSMHCSANVGSQNDLTLFFGLSGTGKTTLSAVEDRGLIGDDEHCWTEKGIFNIEGGCYAKAIDLKRESEPEIWDAIKFGTVLENVVYDETSRTVDYTNTELTENTRASYPIEYIPNAIIPCVGPKPQNIVFLTCDAFGVLPPVSKLTPEQAMYHFISGYTAKVAGTEVGVKEPEATFSACFGAAFMAWHPGKYAELLSEKIQEDNVSVWLVNTGWSGGGYGVGKRFSLKYTRSIIDAINKGELKNVDTTIDEYFGLQIPLTCPGVPDSLLLPQKTWEDPKEYDAKAKYLATLFRNNFKIFESGVEEKVIKAGPLV